jgi:hypothetical protein
MKKFGLLLVLMSLGLFTLGCDKPASTPSTTGGDASTTGDESMDSSGEATAPDASAPSGDSGAADATTPDAAAPDGGAAEATPPSGEANP